MKLSAANKKILVNEIKFSIEKMKETEDPKTRLYFFSAIYGIISRIFNLEFSSDLVIAIITGSTVSRAMAVGQEIGRARGRGKVIIPIVDKDVPKTELGCLDGITYEPFSRENIDHAVQRVKQSVEALKHKKDQQIALFLLGLIIGVIYLSSQ